MSRVCLRFRSEELGNCPSADDLDTTTAGLPAWPPGAPRRDPDRGKQSFALLLPECRTVAFWMS
jgi:hypothetical protein